MEFVNMEKARRIAFADTKHLQRPRWTELSVFYLDEPTESGKRWLAVSAGLSTRPGEKTLSDALATFSLERALDLFDDSQIGRQVKAEARDWAEHNAPTEGRGEPEAVSLHKPAPAEPFTGETDEDALAWLFGGEYQLRPAAKAFDMGESTLRMALRNRTQVRVPLAMIARYVDRERFLADVAAANA